MEAVAALYGTEPAAIEQLTGLRTLYRILVGDFLILPDTGTWISRSTGKVVDAWPVDRVEVNPLPAPADTNSP